LHAGGRGIKPEETRNALTVKKRPGKKKNSGRKRCKNLIIFFQKKFCITRPAFIKLLQQSTTLKNYNTLFSFKHYLLIQTMPLALY
jgi:hypothetical protein